MNPELKILLLEDLEDDAGLIERALRKGGLKFVSKRVDSRDEYSAAIGLFDPDIILSDHALPQFNSIEALRICKEMDKDIPFILVTGAVSDEFAVNCIKQGVDDYVLKSNLTRLPSAILGALAMHESERKKLQIEVAIRKQNDELVKINKELDAFVYSVSHNLRAPLASVLGLINLARIEDRSLGDIFTKYLSMMEKSVTKLDDTLKEILDYSRNSRADISFTKVDLRNLINESFERFKYLEGMTVIDRRVHVEEFAPFYADPYRLSVILNNLVSNSIKYLDKHKDNSFIEIRAIVSEDMMELLFRDNGVGIHEDRIVRIFDMFYRGTERSEGAGLGLYIVKEVVDRLHGTITVDSRLSEGTSFTVRIPNLSPQAKTPENILIDAG